MVSKKDKLKLHQGRLLENLYDWSKIPTQQKFAQRFHLSRYTYLKLVKSERIPKKVQYEICDAYGIPYSYFEGDYQLPSKFELKHLQNDNSHSKNTQPDEITILQNKLLEAQENIIRLQNELLELRRIQ